MPMESCTVDLEKGVTGVETATKELNPRLLICLSVINDVVLVLQTLFYIGTFVWVISLSKHWWDSWPLVLILFRAVPTFWRPQDEKPPPSSSPVDEWTKRFQEAERLVDDVAERIAERESVPPSLPRELQRRTAEIRRKVTILGTRLDMLQEDLSDLPKRQNIGLKQLGKLAEKLSGLSSKAKEVGGQFTMKYASDRNDLLGSSEQSAKIDVNNIADMDNHEMISLQRQVIKEQDSQLEILEETIVSTKHIALAINEEVDLQTRLIDDLDERVEDTSTQLERALKRLKKLNMRVRKGDSCWGILLAIIAAVICVVVVWVLITIKG